MLEIYESDEDYTDEEESVESVEEMVQNMSVRVRSIDKEYNLLHTFENETKVSIEKHWKKRRTHKTDNGLKQYFYCGHDKVNCRVEAFLLYTNSSDEIKFYVEDKEHKHSKTTKTRGLTIVQKDAVKKLYKACIRLH